MLDKVILSRLLATALNNGGDFAEIFFEENITNSMFCEDNSIEKVNYGCEKGIGIRVIKDFRTAYVYTNDLHEANLFKAARMASKAFDNTNRTESPVVTLTQAVCPSLITEKNKDLIASALDVRAENLFQINHMVRDYSPLIKQVTVSAAKLQKKVLIANSLGELVEDQYSRVRMAVNVIAAGSAGLQTAFESLGGTNIGEKETFSAFLASAEKAAARAVNMLTARPAPVGRMPIVMSAEAGGTMVHEACGHGLEADLVQKGLSVYQGRRSQKVASSLVTVIDDATLPGRYGSYTFDDEGNKGQKNILIDQGILVNYMYDRLSAMKDSVPTTGNGRRESYRHKPIPRMSNTFIAPGQDAAEDILKETDRGLLVKKMGGGQVNTTTGDFVFDVQEAYWIENGQISYPVRGATLTGNGPKVLQDIDRVAGDLGFSLGVCGKEGQGVAVSDAQPSIRIKKLLVGGTL